MENEIYESIPEVEEIEPVEEVTEPTLYVITLADGTIIENLTLNGNNYISSEPIEADIFAGNCAPMTISDGENEEIHENAELVQCVQYGNEWWIVFRDISDEEQRMNDIEDAVALLLGGGLDD